MRNCFRKIILSACLVLLLVDVEGPVSLWVISNSLKLLVAEAGSQLLTLLLSLQGHVVILSYLSICYTSAVWLCAEATQTGIVRVRVQTRLLIAIFLENLSADL